MLSIRSVHGCCREVFDHFSSRPFHVRRLLDGLRVRQRQPYLREAQADGGLERLATASMKRSGVTSFVTTIAPMIIGTGLPSRNNMTDTKHRTLIAPATGYSLPKGRGVHQDAERPSWHTKLVGRVDLVYLIYLAYLVGWFVWLILVFEPHYLTGY